MINPQFLGARSEDALKCIHLTSLGFLFSEVFIQLSQGRLQEFEEIGRYIVGLVSTTYASDDEVPAALWPVTRHLSVFMDMYDTTPGPTSTVDECISVLTTSDDPYLVHDAAILAKVKNRERAVSRAVLPLDESSVRKMPLRSQHTTPGS